MYLNYSAIWGGIDELDDNFKIFLRRFTFTLTIVLGAATYFVIFRALQRLYMRGTSSHLRKLVAQ